MIEWILTSSALIAVVILIWLAFRKRLALRVRYALWLAVALLVTLLLAVNFTGRQVKREVDSLSVNAAQEAGDGENQVSGGDDDLGNVDRSESGADDTEITEWVFGYRDYTGYLDECPTWVQSGRDQFLGQDYDGDGLTDRVWRENIEDYLLADYRIDFGNGDVLEMKGWGSGDLQVRSVDLTGDGVPEILVTVSYPDSTDITAFGEMALYEKTAEGYRWMELPGGMVKDPDEEDMYGVLGMNRPTLTYHFEKAGEHEAHITCPNSAAEAPLDVTVDFGAEDWEQLDRDYLVGKDFEHPVWQVEIERREGELPRLLLYTGMLDRNCADQVILTLGYQNGALHMEDIGYYHVYEEFIPIDLGDGKTYKLAVHGSTLLGSGLYQTDAIWRVWVHDNVGEWLEKVDFEAAERDSLGGNVWPLEANSPDGGILLMDLNFDGAQDFCVQAWTGSQDTPYYCFVWNKESEQFTYAGFVPNVELDQENRRIVSSTVDGSGQYSASYYYLDEEDQLMLR